MPLRLALCFVALLLLARPLEAKDQRVPIQQPAKIVTDPSLAVFLESLGRIADARSLKELDGVVGKTFFWERDFGGGHDVKATPIKTLSEALLLDDAKLGQDYKGAGWRRLKQIAASSTFVAGTHGEGKAEIKAVCGPTAPTFKDGAIDDILVWGYVLTKTDIRAKPDAKSESVTTVENEAVEVVEPASAELGQADFAKVKLPNGKTGYLAAGELHSFLDDQLCFAKHGGTWRIVGYIGGGD